jgi:hypothetical protein
VEVADHRPCTTNFWRQCPFTSNLLALLDVHNRKKRNRKKAKMLAIKVVKDGQGKRIIIVFNS